jgi:pimeloyl-ACP methyl ester carboxylesterase
VAEALADEFTVVTYDRRGHSRSPRPEHWSRTSVRSRPTMPPGLLQALDLAPAAAFGLSSQGRSSPTWCCGDPRLLTGAVFHEPGFLHMTSDPDAVGALFGASFDAGMARGGRPAALESFLRLVCHDEVIDGMDPALLDRCLTNADVFFDVEAGDEFRPTPEAWARSVCRVSSPPGRRTARRTRHCTPSTRRRSGWRTASGVPVVEVPGGHVPHASHPEALRRRTARRAA